MKGYDFSSPASLHLGKGSKGAMFALGMALTAAFAPAQAHAKPGMPVVSVAAQQSGNEVELQIGREQDAHRTTAKAVHMGRMGLSEADDAAVRAQLAVEQARVDVVRSAFIQGAEAMAQEKGIGTCFGGFLDGHSHRAALERSTVMLAVKDTTGKTIEIGSGFVVRDSAGADGHDRIVTARHVVNIADVDPLPQTIAGYLLTARTEAAAGGKASSLPDILVGNIPNLSVVEAVKLAADMTKPYETLSSDTRNRMRAILGVAPVDHVDAYGSNGNFIGRMAVAAMGRPDGSVTVIESGTSHVISSVATDWAVMRLDTYATPAAAARRFDRIEGLSLAPLQSAVKTIGISGDGTHPAASPGYSGGPVVDDDGLVHGITSGVKAFDDVIQGNVKHLVSPANMIAGTRIGATFDGEASLAVKQPLIVNPISDPVLLGALGHAGNGIRRSAAAPLSSGTVRMTVLGMPVGYCSATSTIQAPIGAPMPGLVPSVPGVPGAWELRVTKDGTKLSYDGEGRLSEMRRPDGLVRGYMAGTLSFEDRPDGTLTRYENGRPIFRILEDGTGVNYIDGKPSGKVPAAEVSEMYGSLNLGSALK